jgi:hypothetical protein
MVMRDLSPDFLDDYIAAEGPAILSSVGCYHYEGRGAQLFDRVEGIIFRCWACRCWRFWRRSGKKACWRHDGEGGNCGLAGDAVTVARAARLLAETVGIDGEMLRVPASRKNFAM